MPDGKKTSENARRRAGGVIMIVGGGFAGAVAARELAGAGRSVVIVEAADLIGGKVRAYACKATARCENCGVCLANGLWEDVEKNKSIRVMTGARLVDLTGTNGDFTAAVKSRSGVETIAGVSRVAVATGFQTTRINRLNGAAELSRAMTPPLARPSDENTGSILLGSQLEKMLKERGEAGVLAQPPRHVAFVQCFGSRDRKENAGHCSKVCCGYAARAAKVLKKDYPQAEITFFYMETQMANRENQFDALKEMGFHFIKCRPIQISGGRAPAVAYDDPETGQREKRFFDLIVLSDGIRAGDDAGRIAEICGLGQKESGFLKYVTDASEAKKTGVYLIGCAKGPSTIEEVYQDAVASAREILFAG